MRVDNHIWELPPIVYTTAWSELYKLFGERLDQEGLDLMDAVLRGVITEIQDELQREDESASNR